MIKKSVILVVLFVSALITFYYRDNRYRDISSINNTNLISKFYNEIYSTPVNINDDKFDYISIFNVKYATIHLFLNIYIYKLDIESDVRKRIIKKLLDINYRNSLFYFLLSFKNQIIPKGIISSFDKYVKENSKDLINSPGSIHSLFSLDSKNVVKDTLFDSNILALALRLYDAIFIRDNFFIVDYNKIPIKYKYLHTLNERRVLEYVKPILKDLLFFIGNKLNSYQEYYNNFISKIYGDPNKLEGLAISLIDFVRMIVTKIHKKSLLKETRKRQLLKWFLDNYNGKNYDKIISYLENMQKRNFAIHVIVDGLQGSLVDSLVNNDKTFLKKVYDDHKSYTKYRPKHESVKELSYKHQIEFLSYIVNNDYKNSNYLQFFEQLYSNNSVVIPSFSTTPTISTRNLSIAESGAKSSGNNSTGIVNFHYCDREHPSKEGRSYYFFGNDSILMEKITRDSGMISMPKRLNNFNTFSCQFQYAWDANESYEPIFALIIGEKIRDYGEIVCVQDLYKRVEKEKILHNNRRLLISLLRSKISKSRKGINIFPILSSHTKILELIKSIVKLTENAMPDYLMYYNPWPDHYAHFKGPFSDEILSPTGELNRLDYWLTKITNKYKKLGIWDRTLLGITGDHGLTPVYYIVDPQIEVFDKLSKDTGRKFIVRKISSDEGEGPKITNSLNFKSNKNIDAIIASTAGGNFVIDLFNGQEYNIWKKQPTYSELLKWKPLDGKEPIDIIQEISYRLRDSLEYLVVRESNCSYDSPCKVRLVAHRNGKRVDEVVIRSKERKYFYKGESYDLLKVKTISPYSKKSDLSHYNYLINKCVKKSLITDESTWCNSVEWNNLSSYTIKPGSITQVVDIYDSNVAGTINLFPNEGIGYNTKVPGRHAGETFHEKDSLLAFIGGSAKFNKKILSSTLGNLAPTLYEYLTGEKPTLNKGWGYSSLLNQITDK